GKRTVSRGSQKGLWIGVEMKSVDAPCQTDDGPSGAEMGAEKHDVCILMLHHRRVVNCFNRVGNIGFREYGIVAVPSDDIAAHYGLFASRSKSVQYPRPHAPTIVSMKKYRWTRWRHALRLISESRDSACTASGTLLTRNPVRPSSSTSRQEPRSMAMTG